MTDVHGFEAGTISGAIQALELPLALGGSWIFFLKLHLLQHTLLPSHPYKFLLREHFSTQKESPVSVPASKAPSNVADPFVSLLAPPVTVLSANRLSCRLRVASCLKYLGASTSLTIKLHTQKHVQGPPQSCFHFLV